MEKEAKEKLGKTVLITGGTSGVGLECAKNLIEEGYDVIITGRNKQQGEELEKNFGMKFLPLELSSQSSIREFVEKLPTHLPSSFHTLINNAGSQFGNLTTKTKEGIEMTFAVNHLGHFLLTNLILSSGILQRPSKIINVSSGTHDPARRTGIEPPRFTSAENVSKGILEGENLPSLSGIKGGHCAYSTSKLCNILFTFELHRRFEKEGIKDVKVNAFDPGFTPNTNLARNYGPFVTFLFNSAPIWCMKFFMKNTHTVQESGRSLAVLAHSNEFDDVSGCYMEHGNNQVFIADSSQDSLSEPFANDLWAESCKLTDLVDGPIFNNNNNINNSEQ